MKKVKILVVDTIKLQEKRGEIEQKDILNYVNRLEKSQIMLVKGGEDEKIIIFIKGEKKVKSFVQTSSIRSAIESL